MKPSHVAAAFAMAFSAHAASAAPLITEGPSEAGTLSNVLFTGCEGVPATAHTTVIGCLNDDRSALVAFESDKTTTDDIVADVRQVRLGATMGEVPEPATLAMLGLGLLGLGAVRGKARANA